MENSIGQKNQICKVILDRGSMEYNTNLKTDVINIFDLKVWWIE